GVERGAVAVAPQVGSQHVVPERGHPRRQLVEHPPVVEGSVQADHRRRRGIPPPPNPKQPPPQIHEGDPLRRAKVHGKIMTRSGSHERIDKRGVPSDRRVSTPVRRGVWGAEAPPEPPTRERPAPPVVSSNKTRRRRTDRTRSRSSASASKPT